MKTLHAFDEHRYPTGDTREVGDRDPVPPGWTTHAPPSLDGVRFTGEWRDAPTREAWRNRPQILGPAKEARKRDAEREYQRCLERGFSFDGGTFSATGPKRHRVVELVAQQNAGRGMPRGKTSKTFRDNEGNTHDLNGQQIIDLAAAGSDHVEASDDRYEELMGQIQAATTQADLDAIDPSTGWPK